MRLEKLAPLNVTVTLELGDCCAIAAALADVREEGNIELCGALSAGLLGMAFAAFLLSRDDGPHTVATMWERWAPHESATATPAPTAYRPGLPATDCALFDSTRARSE